MSQRSATPKHAVYAPKPPLERRATRSHARPIGDADASKPSDQNQDQGSVLSVAPRRTRKSAGLAVRVRATRPVPKRAASGRRKGAALAVVYPTVMLACALGLAFGALILGLAALLQQTLRGEAERAAFPLLAGGMTLVLLRGQVGVGRYRDLRRRLGLAGDRPTDHAIILCYMLAFFFAASIVATLLACGAALLIGALVHSLTSLR